MKALVLAAAIATAELQQTPVRRTTDGDAARRGRAERKRYTEQDLKEALGDMEPTPDEPQLAAMPVQDFIPWEPAPAPRSFVQRVIQTDLGGPSGPGSLAA